MGRRGRKRRSIGRADRTTGQRRDASRGRRARESRAGEGRGIPHRARAAAAWRRGVVEGSIARTFPAMYITRGSAIATAPLGSNEFPLARALTEEVSRLRARRRVDRSPGLARARLARPLFAEPNARAHSERATDARSSGRFESTVPRRRALPSRARRRPFPSRRVTVSGKAEGGTAHAGAKKPSLD